MKRSALIGTIAAGALVVAGIGVSLTAAAQPAETAETTAATAITAADSDFLWAKRTWTELSKMGDQEIIGLGKLACEQAKDGKAVRENIVLPGHSGSDHDVAVNTSIVIHAFRAYCPELAPR